MSHVQSHAIGVVDDLARAFTFNMRNKADAAVFLLILRIVQATFGRQTSVSKGLVKVLLIGQILRRIGHRNTLALLTYCLRCVLFAFVLVENLFVRRSSNWQGRTF